MSINKILSWIIIVVVISTSLTGCAFNLSARFVTPTPPPSATARSTATITATPFLAVTNTSLVIPATRTRTPTFTPSPTFTFTPSPTPIPTDTPVPTVEWTDTPETGYTPPGEVTAPILLYHHVSDQYVNRYFMSLDDFRTQMQSLKDWGYTSITLTDLVNVIRNGGDLPNRPVVLTFDDGNFDIYQNAFPILQQMGFIGVFYIYVDHVGSNGYVNFDQIKEMADAGWEIGSHSMSHSDLTQNHYWADYEIVQSRQVLEQAIDGPVNTFSYPYGLTDNYITQYVIDSGYIAAVGLGLPWVHSVDTLYDLDRIEIQGDYSLSIFATLLPWSGSP